MSFTPFSNPVAETRDKNLLVMKELTHLGNFFSPVRKDIMVTRPRIEHAPNSCRRFSHADLAPF
jgi:hypothetical protein